MGASPQRTITRSCFVLLVVATLSPSSNAAANIDRRPILPARQIEADLRGGRPVLRTDARVTEKLVLSGLGTVGVSFRCRRCVFLKGIDASDTVFERSVDLTDTHIRGPAIFRGATFQGPAIFAAPHAAGCSESIKGLFRNRADFSLAVFDDLASFDGTIFNDRATFDDAQFRAHSDFSQVCFLRSASFRRADFAGRTSFSQSQFKTAGYFDAASFAEGATFLAGNFAGKPDVTAASFSGASSAGDLNFTFARFVMIIKQGAKLPPPDERADVADFSYVACSGSLFFGDAEFDTGYGIAMDHINVGSLVLDVPVVAQVDDDQDENNERKVLRVIETSAKDRGDLGVANDAYYRLRVLTSNHYGQPWRALDYVFYRGVAGYLVRPLRPLLVLLVMVVLFAVIRAFRAQRSEDPERRSRGEPLRRFSAAAWTWSQNVLADVFDTLARVVPGRGNGGELSLGRRVETLAYRVLVVCSLLALANANPTLREMVDSLF